MRKKRKKLEVVRALKIGRKLMEKQLKRWGLMVMSWGQLTVSHRSGTQVTAFSLMQNQLMAARKVVWNTCTKCMDSSFQILSALQTYEARSATLASRSVNLHKWNLAWSEVSGLSLSVSDSAFSEKWNQLPSLFVPSTFSLFVWLTKQFGTWNLVTGCTGLHVSLLWWQ